MRTLLLTTILVLAGAACGSSDGDGSAPVQPTTTTGAVAAASPLQAAAPTEPAAPADSTAPDATAAPAEAPTTFLPAEAEAVANGLGDVTYDLPGCPAGARGAVTDKAEQRYWLCMDGRAVTAEIPMTTASSNYGLPPVGTYEVFARQEDAYGIGGEPLERFVAFYTTPKGNRIAFHEVVNQDPATVGDLDQRGQSAGCFRVREADSIQVWEFLQIGDPVVVLTN